MVIKVTWSGGHKSKEKNSIRYLISDWQNSCVRTVLGIGRLLILVRGSPQLSSHQNPGPRVCDLLKIGLTGDFICVLSSCLLSGFSHVWLFATLWTARLLCPWNSPGKNTAVGCHFLLQWISLSRGLNPCLMSLALAGGFFITGATWESPWILVSCLAGRMYHLSHQGNSKCAQTWSFQKFLQNRNCLQYYLVTSYLIKSLVDILYVISHNSRHCSE